MQYVKTSLVRETRAYANAGYFDRNVRMIDVLVNRGKLRGVPDTPGAGLYYDLGHGYCTYEFFAQCPHWMACARCPFYVPREADAVRILEAEGALVRLRQDLQLTEEERLAVDGDVAALRALRAKHWDTPTPAGATARDLEEARLRAGAARFAHLDGLPLLT